MCMESFIDNDSLDQGYEALLFMVQDGLGRLPPAVGGVGGRGSIGSTVHPGDVGAGSL